MTGTRLRRLTDALGLPSCRRCRTLAAHLDEQERRDPGWSIANRSWIVERVTANAAELDPDRVEKHLGTIARGVDLAILGGPLFYAVLAALTADKVLRKTPIAAIRKRCC